MTGELSLDTAHTILPFVLSPLHQHSALNPTTHYHITSIRHTIDMQPWTLYAWKKILREF